MRILSSLQWSRGFHLGWDPFLGKIVCHVARASMGPRLSPRMGPQLSASATSTPRFNGAEACASDGTKQPQVATEQPILQWGRGLNLRCRLTLAERWWRCNRSGCRRGKDDKTAPTKPSHSEGAAFACCGELSLLMQPEREVSTGSLRLVPPPLMSAEVAPAQAPETLNTPASSSPPQSGATSKPRLVFDVHRSTSAMLP